ncbi:SDR family oxidoreductase [Devosia sp. RR2S18]|uniref:SDR family oxidoreductase n=1 Tax=Devosia rhizosphaerae TaxID=3049774 RepID=UPI002541CE2D|nr:SDR family oxidoreductase [Devosia sp. RR2S18]WIJ25072.1 SDR family oxidoreductase [Devosia sp. RR2S18]
MKLSGTTAFVTGAASGLGAAMAKHLAAAGARVAVFDRNSGGQAVADAIGGVYIQCDVADAKEAEAAVGEAVSVLGNPSVLVNCAGVGTAKRIVGREGPMPLEDFERVVRINLIGSFNMLRLAAHAMQAREPDSNGQRGVIISTASVAAYEGQVGQAAYAASKGGIVALTLPAAREFAQFGIRVLAVAPGLFLTPLLQELPDDVQTALAASIPNPSRLGRPEEFAHLVLALAENDYMNGEVVRLDGGLRMQAK